MLTDLQLALLDEIGWRSRPVSSAEIAEITGRTRAAAARSADALIRRGLLTVNEDGNLIPTEKGRRRYAATRLL